MTVSSVPGSSNKWPAPGTILSSFSQVSAARGLPVQLEDMAVVAADDQQRGRHDLGKPRPCEVRASSPRHHRGDPVVEFRGREQGRAGAGAGAEQAERQIGDVGLAADPERRFHHAFGKQRNVEDVAAVVRFGWCQKVEEKGREAVGIEHVRDGDVARTEPARSAAMREQNDAAGLGRNAEISDQAERRHRDLASCRSGLCARASVPALRPALAQQPDGFLVGQLVEVVVEGADAVEMLGGVKTYDQIGLLADLLQGFLRRHRHRDADFRGTLSLHRDQGRLHGRPGRQAIVDDDRRMPGRVDLRTAAEVASPAALEFRQFARSGAFEKGVIRAGAPAHLLVDHGLRVFAVDDGAERHFRRARSADLAHKYEVERGAQGAGDLDGDRHPAARQRIDDRPIQPHREPIWPPADVPHRPDPQTWQPA